MEYNARASFPFNGSSSSSSGHQYHSASTPGSSSAGSGASGNSSSGSHSGGGSGSGSRGGGGRPSTTSQFDVINWYPKYQSCQRYFIEVAQHSYPCQALAAFINIKLPFQRVSPQSPAALSIPSSRPPQFRHPPGYNVQQPNTHPTISPFGWVSLHPYMRRLVATGFDVPAILHGWFGDDWEGGVGPLHEQERRNYLFAAKSGGWASVKKEYDVVMDEAVPYLMPLSGVNNGELEGAEGSWSRWLAMEDWMLGARAPVQRDADMDDGR